MKTTYKYCHEQKRLVRAEEVSAPPEPKYDPSANYDEYLNGPKSGTFMKCKLCGDMHDVYNWPGNHMPEQYDLRSELGAPYFISDNLESLGGLNGIQNQADGRFYTSKAKLRADYRARGMIEVGNDPQRLKPFQKPKPDRKAIKESLHRAMHIVKNEGGTAANYRARSKGPKGAFGAVAK